MSCKSLAEENSIFISIQNLKIMIEFSASLTHKISTNFLFTNIDNLSIFSFAYWSLLTDLPKSNGLIYFIVDYLALDIDTTGYRQYDVTGCI